MFARRMLTFAAILLALTMLAAVFAPPPPETGTVREAPSSADPAAVDADVVPAKLDADAPKRRTITLREGDRLRLEVTGSELDAVTIEGLTGVKPLGPEAVANFDVLMQTAGTYRIRLTLSERTLATVRVSPPPREGLAPTDALERPSPI